MSENDDVSSRTLASRLRWDAFLNFRGEDTRDTFTQRLYDALYHNGVRAFLDNNGSTQGDSLAPTLLDAIQDSAASIAIISPNYASSRWCLEELATICDFKRLVLPVFYRVDPSDVRRQRGPFQEDFHSLERTFGNEVVLRWRKAMEEVGGKKGWVFQNESEEPQLIDRLVKRVLTELRNTPMMVAPYLVGLDFPMNKLMKLLDVKRNSIQVLGFHGMGGIGKTTLAKALYNKLAGHFEHRSFISNVRENSGKQNGLVSLQNKLLGDLAKGHPPVNDVSSGKVAIKSVLHDKRVLVILDDVDDVIQLEALAGHRDWIYEGSRVIISTRDTNVLLTSLVNEVYEVRNLNFDDSLKLFSYHAFRRQKPPTKTFSNLSDNIVHVTGGLPLSLEVFGSFLFDKRRVEEWKDALQKLKKIRPNNLQGILKISFDGLDEHEKCIFLDIACLFLNLAMLIDEVIDVVKGCGFNAEIAISVLIARSLIKVMDNGTLWMHDQIRDMGRQIDLLENHGDPGARSRLWDCDEVLSVLQDGRERSHILGMLLDFEKKNFLNDTSARNNLERSFSFTSVLNYLKQKYKEHCQHWAKKDGEVILHTKPFQQMGNLRLLHFRNVQLHGNFKNFPSGIKWLRWKGCPLKNLPSNFCPRELTVLDLSESKIASIWGKRRQFWYRNKVLLRNMVEFSIPGSEIPCWFSPEEVVFSERKNRVIKNVIIALVVSVQIPGDLIHQFPAILGVRAMIFRFEEQIFRTDMHLVGVPKTNEDQVYLYRYKDHRPLVSLIREGDRIRVAMRNPPVVEGVELKKCGIHLVFENDDDYEGDEELLDVSQQSVSEKLTKFFKFPEENNHIPD